MALSFDTSSAVCGCSGCSRSLGVISVNLVSIPSKEGSEPISGDANDSAGIDILGLLD